MILRVLSAENAYLLLLNRLVNQECGAERGLLCDLLRVYAFPQSVGSTRLSYLLRFHSMSELGRESDVCN